MRKKRPAQMKVSTAYASASTNAALKKYSLGVTSLLPGPLLLVLFVALLLLLARAQTAAVPAAATSRRVSARAVGMRSLTRRLLPTKHFFLNCAERGKNAKKTAKNDSTAFLDPTEPFSSRSLTICFALLCFSLFRQGRQERSR